MYGQPGPEPPLGWTLAPSTIEDMRKQLGAKLNRQTIEAVRQVLGQAAYAAMTDPGGPATYTPDWMCFARAALPS
jgi:hypothetical protein